MGSTISSREFNQAVSRAKKAAEMGPVFITHRGRPSHVLLSMSDYERLSGSGKTIVDLLAMDSAADIEFEPPRLGDVVHRPAALD